MLLALRTAIDQADGMSLDLDELARRLGADRAAVRSALVHGIERGWFPGVEVAALPAACGTAACTPQPSRAACRRCPLAA